MILHSSRWKQAFSLDLRSLSLFRIGLGLVLLYDLWDRAQDLRAHYTSAGILPLNLLKENFAEPYFWSLHYINDSYRFQSSLFIIAGLFALSLLLGYRTRLATLISWALLCSLQMRNPLVLQFGDLLLRILLFWAIFLPLSAYFSLDKKFSRIAKELPKRIFSGASIAFLLQLAFVYWFTAALKTGADWWQDGTAVYYSLSFETLATGWGLWLTQFPVLLKFFTYATLVLEILGPLLIIVPFWNGPLRFLVVLSFILFHLALALTLHLGIFPWVCIVAWSAVLPTRFWERGPGEENFYSSPSWINFIAISLLFYILIWNVRTVCFKCVAPWFPYQANRIGEYLRLEQRWGMYAPRPTKLGGWLVIPGTLQDGTQVDLYRNGAPIQWEKPLSVAKTFSNDRWGNYLTRIWAEDFKEYRPRYAQFLCEEWRQGKGERKSLTNLEIYQQRIVVQEIPLPPKTHRVLLFRYACPNT